MLREVCVPLEVFPKLTDENLEHYVVCVPEKILDFMSIIRMFEVNVPLEGIKTNPSLMFLLTTERYTRKSLLVISSRTGRRA